MVSTIRENYDKKYPRTLILSPDPELSTPTKSRHTMCLVQVSSWCLAEKIKRAKQLSMARVCN